MAFTNQMYSNETFIKQTVEPLVDQTLGIYDLSYCEVPGKYFGENLRDQYQKVYSFWHRVWSHTFSEINMKFSDFSDEFCRHETVLAVQSRGEVIGCVLVDQFDLLNEVHLKHHYFENYTEEIIQSLQLRAKNTPVMTVGYLTLDPNFRKKSGFTDIILGFAVKKFFESESELLISYTRNTRKTNDLTVRLGAKILKSDLMVRGEPSDFVYFDHLSKKVFLNHPNYQTIENLWADKIDFKTNNKNKTNQQWS